MKKTILILLAILLVATMTTALVACEQDPCEIKGHIWDEGSVTLEPTCQTEGKLLRRCLVCGETVEEPTAKVDHVWGEPTVTVPATCSTDGQGTVKCQNCTETHDYTIPATGNHVVNLQAKHEAVEATCWREGTVEYYDCQTCGDKVKLDVYGNVLDEEALSVAKTAHNYDNGVITKSPTCSDTGIKTFTCQNEGCTGDGHTFEQVLDKIEHVFGRLIPAQDATCTEAGHIAYYQCSECHAFFDERKTPIDESQLAVKELGHKEKTLSAEQATCQHTGLTEGIVCERCGEVLQQQQKTDKLPHKPEPYGAVAPTCEATGYSAGSRCSECKTIIIYPKTLAALGHSYKLTQWNWTDANTKATAEFRCDNANCPHPVVTVEAQVTGEDVLDYKVFTATAQGPDGKIYTETKQVGEHEHSYVLKNWTWAPDYSKATAHFNCPVCEADPHDVEVTPTSERTESTCTVAGKITYTATADYNGVTATDTRTVELQLAEHKLGAKLEYDADHPENGHGYRCETCKQIITYDKHVMTDKHSTTQHWQACECGYTTEKLPHNFTYQGADGKATHTKVCPDCKYSITENCNVGDDGICTFCQTNDGKEALIVHFHMPSDWTGTLHLHVWNNSNSNLAGSWPGAKGFEAEPGFTGWYVIRFRMATSNFNSSLQIIVNDGSKQTGNISVPTTTKEIYVPAITGGTEAFTDREAALAKESNVPGPTDYFLAGTINGENMWGGGTTGDWSNVFTETSQWKLTFSFKANDQFRILKNDGKYDKEHGYDQRVVTKASTVKGNIDLLFKRGSDMDDNNFVVQYACTLEITFNPNGDGKVHIYVTSASTLPGGETPATVYWLVGSPWGVEWGEDKGGKQFTYHADSKTYTVEYSFKKGDQWQIKPAGTWAGQIGGSSISRIYSSISLELPSVPAVFTGAGDITANYDCTVTITITADKKLEIDVTAITITEVKTYEYVMYVYASNWTKMYLYAYDGPFSEIAISMPPSYEMTRIGTSHWFTATVTSTRAYGVSQNFIVSPNNSWSGQVNFEKPATVWNQKEMYFNVTGVKRGTSPAGVGAPALPSDHTHAYELTGWQWNDAYTQATATFTCTADGCNEKTVTKIATGTAIKENITLDPTCTAAGSKTYTATVTGPDKNSHTDTTDPVAIPALGHKYTGEWTWSEEGGISAKLVLTCSQCEDGDGHTKTITATVDKPAVVEATCTTAGSKTFTATATVPTDDGNSYPEEPLTATKQDNISALAHSYKVDETKGDKVKGLVWNDDYSFATLYLVCEHDAAHTLEYTFDSTTTNGGDCTSASTTTYTVEVTQEAVQAKVTAENEGGTVTMDTLTLTYVDETAGISGHNWTLQNVVWGGGIQG